MVELRRVGVFCGSQHGTQPAYRAAARALGECLVARGLGLVYGGGRVGLMGVLADAVLGGGGEVLGVIPSPMVSREIAHEGCSELVTVGDLFERKARMMEAADAFVSLPGGVGTLDELFEILTWNQLGYLAKPNGLLDVAGFWGPLLAALDHTVRSGFLRQEHRDLLLHDDDPDRLLDALARWQPAERDALER